MAVSEAQRGRAFVLRTAVAIILAIVVQALAAAIASKFFSFMWSVFSNLKPGVISFVAGIIGAFLGMFTARAACDVVLKYYSDRAVTITFWLFAIWFIVIEATSNPLGYSQISFYVYAVAVAVAALVVFWRRIQISN